MSTDGIPGLHLHQGAPPTGSIDALAAFDLAMGKKVKVPNLTPKAISFFKDQLDGRPYQKEGVAWLVGTLQTHGGAILADEMGLGKTFQTIQLLRRTLSGRALVLCPGSVRETWRDELLKWGYKANEIVIMYPGAKPALWVPKVVVCSYHHDMISRAIEHYFQGEYPEFLILDEAHRLRGRDTKRSAVLNDLKAMIPYKLALTGTPQWSSMKDWWQLLHILFDNRFGNQWDFDRRYAGAISGLHGGLDYPKPLENPTPKQLAKQRAVMHTDELQLRLSYYMLSRLKQDVAKDLPPMTVSIRWVDPTPEARRALAKFQMNIGKGSIHEAIISTLKGKVDEVLALAEEAQRFVLTTWTNEGAGELHRLLNDRGVGCLLLTASMSGPKRAEVVRTAAARRCGIVATTDLLAEGLNLQSVASVGILHALDFSPSKMAQLFNRLHRIDIVDPVQWHVVAMKGSIDQYIIDAGVFKLESIQAVMGQNKNKELGKALRQRPKGTLSDKQALTNIYAAMAAGGSNGVQHEDGYKDD